MVFCERAERTLRAVSHAGTRRGQHGNCGKGLKSFVGTMPSEEFGPLRVSWARLKRALLARPEASGMAESACLDGIPAGLWRWPFLWGSEPSSF